MSRPVHHPGLHASDLIDGSPGPRIGTGETRATLPISGIVICKNEVDYIGPCLASIAMCRQIVVVDSGSTDGTIAVVEELRRSGLPIVLIHQEWLGYASQKQFALAQANQPWCLSIDADERLDAALQRQLPDLIRAEDGVAGWKLRRLPSGMGALTSIPRGVYAKPILRLVRREGSSFDERAIVHEGLVVAGRVRIATGGLLRHDRHLPFDAQLSKELGYARLKAIQRVQQGRRPSLARLVFNPCLYFLRLYVAHRWFLCGRAGFVHAVTAAIYSFFAEAMHFERAAQAKAPRAERGTS